jgi:hypothetical protein
MLDLRAHAVERRAEGHDQDGACENRQCDERGDAAEQAST